MAMKLAEALIRRADIQKRMAQLQARIDENVRVQEGDAPAEDPNRLISEYRELVDQWVVLIERINRTNLTVTLPDGQTLTQAIAVRDGMKAKAAIGKQARVTRTEVKFVSMVNVGGLREEADQLARDFRVLDSMIQAANWNFDVAE